MKKSTFIFVFAFCLSSYGQRSFDFGIDEKELFKQITTQDSGFARNIF